MTIRWDANSEANLAGYIVEYGPSSSTPSTSVNVGNVTERQITGLQTGTTYYFRVMAYNTVGQRSSPSPQVSYTVPSAPTVTLTAVSPTSGPTAGGTTITLIGTNFGPSPTVRVGGNVATNMTRVSSTTVTARTPAGTAGLKTVQISTNGQTVSRSNAFTYTTTSTSAPTLTSVQPNTGWTGGGTLMTLTGTNFVSGARVTVGGRSATNVTFVSSTQLRAKAPSGSAGAKTVTVTNPNGQTASRSSAFTYRTTAGTPSFTSVSPNSGPRSGGTLVTIRGANFLTGHGMRVRIGGYNLTNFQYVSTTELRGRTPASSTTGWKALNIRNGDGLSVTVNAAFQYTSSTSSTSSSELTSAASTMSVESDAVEGSTADARLAVEASADLDGDGLPTQWETRFGLAADSADAENGAAGDPDDDGVSNAEEYRNGTHPRGLFRRYFADGALSADVDTRFAIANEAAAPASVVLSFSDTAGAVTRVPTTVAARSRTTFEARSVEALASASFSTELESDQPVALDRLMVLGGNAGGVDVETAVERPSTLWYLAEGSTNAPFSLTYVVQNPNDAAAEVQVRYLLPDGAASLTKTYTVEAHGRLSIAVGNEDAALASTDVAAEISSLNDTPIVVERSMTVARDGGVATGGHNSVGVTAPAARWFLQGSTADGAMALLIANPGEQTATLSVTYALEQGERVVKTHQVEAGSRSTVVVASEDARLERAAMGIYIESANGTPVVVERTTWSGPRSTPEDGSSSAGVTEAGGRWLVAEAEQGGARGAATSVVVSNTGGAPARVAVTLLFENGPERSATFEVAGYQRLTLPIARAFAGAEGRFSVLVEGLDPATAVGLVVERTISWRGGRAGRVGADAVGTRLPQ